MLFYVTMDTYRRQMELQDDDVLVAQMQAAKADREHWRRQSMVMLDSVFGTGTSSMIPHSDSPQDLEDYACRLMERGGSVDSQKTLWLLRAISKMQESDMEVRTCEAIVDDRLAGRQPG